MLSFTRRLTQRRSRRLFNAGLTSWDGDIDDENLGGCVKTAHDNPSGQPQLRSTGTIMSASRRRPNKFLDANHSFIQRLFKTG